MGHKQPLPPTSELLRLLLVGSAYLSILIGLHRIQTDSWRLSLGLTVGLVLAFGFRYLLLAFGGQALAASWAAPGPLHPTDAILAAGAAALICILASIVIRLAFREPEIDLFNSRHLRNFLLLVPVAGIIVSLGTVALGSLEGRLSTQDFWSVALAEAAANSAGILLVTPAFLLIFPRSVERTLAKLSGQHWMPTADSSWWQHIAVPAAGGALCAIFMVSVADRFGLLCLVLVPMGAVAMKHGNSGVAGMLVTLGCLASGAAAYGYDEKDSLGAQAVVIVSGANALLLGSAVSRRRLQEGITRRQSALLGSLRFATDGLLDVADTEETVTGILQHLATECRLARIYVLENSPGDSTAQPIYKHWQFGSPDDARHSALLDKALRKRISENEETLSKGEVLQYRTADLPEAERGILIAKKIHRSTIVPIFVHERLWGCLGLDQGPSVWNWPEVELNAFKAAGRVLAALLSHANVEQQFRQLTGNIPAVFWIATPDGLEKTYVSPAYEQIWGWPYESILTNPRSWIARLYHKDYERISAAIPKQAMGEYDEEYRIVRSDRSVRWIRETAFPVLDTSGQIKRIVGIAQDITRQKEAEERLQATSVLLSSLIDNLHVGILVEDQSRRVIHVNQAFCKMFNGGACVEALLGKDLKLALPLRPEWANRIDEIIREKKECRNEEMVSAAGRVFCRDYFPLAVDGDRHYHLWRYEDITDRKRGEERICTSLKEKEVLLKEIHHRVKNNLQIISSLMNLPASQIRDKEMAEAFRDSQARVKAMSLVHERLYQSSDLAQIDFAGYVRDVTNHLLRSYQIGRHVVRLRVDVEPVSLNIDTAIPCALIINELVSNSLKYAFPSGRDGEIRVCMNHTETDDLNLTIADNGVGFPEDVFWQETDSLGLQLVRNLTDQLNGSIQYHLAKGAQFDIRFRPVSNGYQN